MSAGRSVLASALWIWPLRTSGPQRDAERCDFTQAASARSAWHQRPVNRVPTGSRELRHADGRGLELPVELQDTSPRRGPERGQALHAWPLGGTCRMLGYYHVAFQTENHLESEGWNLCTSPLHSRGPLGSLSRSYSSNRSRNFFF